MKSRLVHILLLTGLSLSLAGTYLVWRASRGPAPAVQPGVPTVAATLINDSKPLPPFTLQSPRGILTNQSLLDHWTFMFFGYTQCPDVCPSTLSMIAEVERKLDEAVRPGVLFVSVDPARDTKELLGQFVPAFNPAFVGAAGSDDDLSPLTRHLGVMYRRHDEKDPRNYTVDHTASLFLIDPQGRLKAVFSPPHDPDQITRDYRSITRP